MQGIRKLRLYSLASNFSQKGQNSPKRRKDSISLLSELTSQKKDGQVSRFLKAFNNRERYSHESALITNKKQMESATKKKKVSTIHTQTHLEEVRIPLRMKLRRTSKLRKSLICPQKDGNTGELAPKQKCWQSKIKKNQVYVTFPQIALAQQALVIEQNPFRIKEITNRKLNERESKMKKIVSAQASPCTEKSFIIFKEKIAQKIDTVSTRCLKIFPKNQISAWTIVNWS